MRRRTYDTRRLRAAAVADAVAAVIAAGGTVAFPTDTVYGIGCDPVRPDAVAKIYALKGRDPTKPLVLHLATVEELLEYAPDNAFAALAAERFLPGPLTVIVRRPAHVGAFVSAGLDTIGLRVPAHEVARVLLERCGPLAATSANYSGFPAFTGQASGLELPAVDVRIDDGPTPLGTESTVIDVSGDRPRILRVGAVSVAQLAAVFGMVDAPPHAGKRNGVPECPA